MLAEGRGGESGRAHALAALPPAPLDSRARAVYARPVSFLATAYLVVLILLLVLWRAAWRPRGVPGVRRTRPLLVGHRGTRTRAPENTLEAFRVAFEAGLDGIEFDVQRSADGALVLLHDERIDGRAVAALPADEVRVAGATVPRLDELLELARAYPGRLLNLEIKASSNRTRGLEREVVRQVRASGLADRVLVSSFNPVALARVRLAAPQMRTALLYAPEQGRLLRRGALAPWLHVDAIHPHHSLVDGALMERAHRRGLAVNTWTVNDEADARRLMALGVDAIMGDDPERLRQVAGRA